MNKRELNKHLNNIIELEKQLKAEKELLLNGMTEKGMTSISTAQGQAYITEESTAMTFSTTRFGFKEKYPDIYNANLVETVRKRHITVKGNK